MAIDIIYANADDYYIESSSGSWATARAGTGSFFTGDPADTGLNVGAIYDDGGTFEYYVQQAPLHFDTSAVTGTVSVAPALVLSALGSNDTIEAMEQSWSGSGSGNFVAGASLAANYGPTAVSGTGAKTLTKTNTTLSISSSYGLIVYSQRQRTNVAPTGNTTSSQFYSANQTGTTNDPYLSITTVTTTDYTLTADAGSFAETGGAASLGFGARLAAAAGSFAQTGQTAALRLSAVLSAQAGSFSLTGGNASLGFVYTLTASPGSFAATGQDATLKVGNTLTAQAGGFTLAGGSAVLGLGQRLTAAAGSFAITGSDALLQKVSSHSIASMAGITTPYRPARVSPNPTPRAPRRDR